jgi:DUF971 family protein
MVRRQEVINRIDASKSNRIMEVEWWDGHISTYPFSLLRAACPCAMCRGGHENMSPEPDPQVFFVQLDDSEKTRISEINPVGGYGIQFVWQDSHDDGIFTWHYLRSLCPCEECRQFSE